MKKNLLLSFFTIVILLFGLEGVSRIFSNPLYVYDETLGYTLKSGSTTVHEGKDFKAIYKINKLGYRGKAYSKIKPPGIFRIVLIGDSHGFGWGITDYDKTFPAILDQRLSNVEVINLSVSGYGTDQEFIRLKKEGLEYQPDLVLLQISDNDFTEIKMPEMYGRPKPFFILQNGKLMLQNTPVKSICNPDAQYFKNCLPLPFRDWLYRNSVAYNVIDSRYRKLMLRLNTYIREKDTASSESKLHINKFDENGIKLFKAIVNEMSHELYVRGIKLILIHWEPYLSGSDKIDDIGIPIIDLYPTVLKNKEKEVLIDDGHFNIKGHSLIAEELLKALKEYRALPE